MRALRGVLIGVAGLLVVALAGIAVFLATLDTEALKPRITAAVEEATGRRLTIAGPIRIGYVPVPHIVVDDVAFANMQGGSRPEMARIRQVQLQLGVLPLLAGRLELRSLRLSDPDILLETDTQGRSNWVFAVPRPASAPPVAGAPAAPPRAEPGTSAMRVDIGEILITGGRITWHDHAAGVAHALSVGSLDVLPSGPSGPVRIRGDFGFAGGEFQLRGETGALLTPARDRPWPFQLNLSGAGLEARAEGSLARAGSVQDWTGRLDLRVTVLERLQPLVDLFAPEIALPALRDVRLVASFSPRESALSLTIGASDLSFVREGLRIARLEIATPALDQPMRIVGEGTLNGTSLGIAGNLGALVGLLPGAAPAPVPIDLAITFGTARASLAGRVTDPRRLSGAALDIGLRIEDSAALALLAGRAMPALGPVEARAHVATGDEGIAGPVRLTGLRLTAPAANFSGELELLAMPRPALRGRLEGALLDIDALRAAFAPPGGTQASPPAPPPAPVREAGPRRLIPATPIPFDALRAFDADLRFALTELRADGVVYRDLAGTLALEDGRARLEPLGVTLPGGRVALVLSANSTADPPTLRITARHDGAGLDLAPIFAAYRLPRYASGLLELDLDLAGQGGDWRGFAGSANGHVALAMPGGRIERGLIAAIPDQLRALLLPPGAAENGLVLRCFALRAPTQRGMLRSEMFLFDTAVGRVGGGGTVNLREEALALRLLPDLRVGPVQLRAPVNIGGTLAAPRFASADAAGAAAAAGIGALLGTQRTPDRNTQSLADALGGSAAPALPDCGSALAAARAGSAAPAIPPAGEGVAPRQTDSGTPAPAPRRTQNDVPRAAQDVWRGLSGGRR